MHLAKTRRIGGLVAIASAAVIIGLLIAGLQTTQIRTYALRQPNLETVAALRHGHVACEGPVTTTTPARGVAIFGTPSGRPTIHVHVRSTTGLIASGELREGGQGAESDVRLDRTVPANRPVHVCVSVATGAFSLMGAGAQAPGVLTRGVSPGMQFALVLTRPATFLGSLGTAFSRASLFKPSWVGSWTFWLLLALLAFTFPLAGSALVRALDDDEADENPHARNDSS